MQDEKPFSQRNHSRPDPERREKTKIFIVKFLCGAQKVL